MAHVEGIKGLFYLPEYVTSAELALLQGALLAGPSEGKEASRRRPPATWAGIHWHGFQKESREFAVGTSAVSVQEACGPVLTRLRAQGLVPHDYSFDQVIVNDYVPDDDGLAPHVDRECFDDIIVAFSVGASCVMTFRKLDASREVRPVLLEERSVLIMSGESRWKWNHGIAPRPHVYEGVRVPCGRRTSVTFRKLCTERPPPAKGHWQGGCKDAVSRGSSKATTGLQYRTAANFFQEAQQILMNRLSRGESSEEMDMDIIGLRWKNIKHATDGHGVAIRQRFEELEARDKERAKDAAATDIKEPIAVETRSS